MCLATVYGKKQESESILIKNASRLDVDYIHGGSCKLSCEDQLHRGLGFKSKFHIEWR